MADNVPAGLALGRDRHLARAVDAGRRRARRSAARSASAWRTTSTCPTATMARSNGDLIAKARADDRRRRPPAGDGRRGARAARRARARPRGATRRRERCRSRASASSTSSRLLPGGFCSLLLADFGADVVKVEDTGHGRLRALVAAATTRAPTDSAAGALFLALNRNKRSIRIDLKTDARPRGAAARSARDADVVLESFRPGVLDRLGVGYEALREVNPRHRRTARSPATARTARCATAPGHDMNYLGLDRAARPDRRRATGRRSRPPARSPTSAAAR